MTLATNRARATTSTISHNGRGSGGSGDPTRDSLPATGREVEALCHTVRGRRSWWWRVGR